MINLKSRNRATITFFERQRKKEIVDFWKKENKISKTFQKKNIVRKKGR